MNYLHYFRELHKNQVRKYTGNPYSDHLAEVAGIAISAESQMPVSLTVFLAVCWGHDSIEDQDETPQHLSNLFGYEAAAGIYALSDLEFGNRAERQELKLQRLSQAPGWIQTIKCADILSNTSSIVKHDPNFAKLYLQEVSDILNVMTKADRGLSEYVKGEVAKCL